VVPHAFDQFMFARHVHERGLGPKPLPKRALTVERLAEGLRALTDDGAMRERARVTGERIRSRDPLRAAVTWLESALPGREERVARTG
jgi:UDP:flavonoid glycosyltransferase YjiC (YdhE family)